MISPAVLRGERILARAVAIEHYSRRFVSAALVPPADELLAAWRSVRAVRAEIPRHALARRPQLGRHARGDGRVWWLVLDQILRDVYGPHPSPLLPGRSKDGR